MVIMHSGTPGAGTLFGPLVETGAQRGLRHLAYSRPGYARSDRDPGRAVADCAQDVAAIVDELGIESFFTIGFSGGGPHALACAGLLGERVDAAATVGGVAPWQAEGLDWLAGMGEENLEEFGAVQAVEEQLFAYLERFHSELAHANGPDLHAALGDLLSDVDKSALSGEFAEYMAESIRRGLSDGIWGWVASHVSGARPHLYAEHGHLSLAIGAYGEILDDLIGSTR